MSHSLGTADFFTLEAGECLNRLEALLARPEGVSGEEFVRQVRLLRGAALMANLQPVAQAGAAFEALARGVRDGLRPWDAATRETALQVVDDFRGLVRRVGQWSDGDTARARRIATDLERMTGQAPAAAPAGAANAQTGVRAFVAREGALIASALDRAARAMRSATDSREALHAVLRRMQQLRGLAELSEFTPLPELLDGIELAVGELARSWAPSPGAAEMLDAAGHALNRICRDVSEQGQPEADTPEAREFTALLRRTIIADDDVVSIESLVEDGESTPGARGRFALGAVELVSHGEFLALVADRVTAASSDIERDLRLLGLLAPLGALAAGARELTLPVSEWAALARTRIADGRAGAGGAHFATQLRNVGRLLRGVADASAPGADDWTLALAAMREGASVAAPEEEDTIPVSAPATPVVSIDDLAPELVAPPEEEPDPEIMALLDLIVPSGTPTPVPAPAPAVPDVTPAAAMDDWEFLKADAVVVSETADTIEVTEVEATVIRTDDEADVVDINDLLAAPEAPVLVDVAEPSAFEASLIAYSELLHDLGLGGASLEGLMGGRAPAPVATAQPPAPAARAEPAVVAIDELLYRGRSALLRADEIRTEMLGQLRRGQHIAVLRPLLDELLDLVPLALDDR